MTGSAVVPELAAMHVVAAVAARAIRPEIDLPKLLYGFAMTALAVETAVRTVERERRLAIVIEAPTRPVDGRMTDRAIGREP
jgi:hypothetical protein